MTILCHSRQVIRRLFVGPLCAVRVFRAPGTHAPPLLFLIITDVSLITRSGGMLLPAGWAVADIQWQHAGGRQRRRDGPDPDEDVTL